MLAILRGKLVPPGGGNFGRKISKYVDLWEKTRRNPPKPLQPRRSTFWDQPLASERTSPIRSHCPSLPVQHSEVGKVTSVQSPVGAERSSSKPSQLAPWLANNSTANPTSTQHWARWNPTAKEYYPSSSLYAMSLDVSYRSPAETLTTNNTPLSSPEFQQGTDAPHLGPINTRHDMRPAAAPTTMESPVSYPFQAPSFRSVHPILPQHAVASAAKGIESAASALARWEKNHPNMGPLREVLSQSIYGKQDQTRHQEELELRKRNGKEEAAMRGGRVRPLF